MSNDREFDSVIGDKPQNVLVGSITFNPSKEQPRHSATEVLLQAEVERLRVGNADLIRQLNAAHDIIRAYETKQFVVAS